MAEKIEETVATNAGSKTNHELVEAVRVEHELTFLQAIKLYPSAIGWSIYVSLGIIMLAFDPQLMGNLYSTPAFARDFGHKYKQDVGRTSLWTLAGVACTANLIETWKLTKIPAGAGGLFVAYPMDMFGRKLTFNVAVVLTGLLVLLQFFARSLPVLLAGELLAGIVEGAFLVIVPAYISEICPMALRGHLTSYVNLCFVVGQLLANGVTTATHNLNSHWAYSIPFAVQWFWVIILLPGIVLIPESPWWLARKGRLSEAESVLRRLVSEDKINIPGMLAAIVATDELEQELEAGSTYMDCFRPTNRRRTEISFGVYCTQSLSGIYLINFATYFFQQAGLTTDQSFDMSLGFLGWYFSFLYQSSPTPLANTSYQGLGFLGSISSWITLVYFGRRTLYVGGLAILVFLQLLIGVLDCIPGRPAGAVWTESSMMGVWNFFYDATIGPVAYIFLSECSATRVRSRTIAAATAAQALVGIIMNVAIPYMINPEEANMQGKLGFFFGGLASLCLLWAYFRVPETEGRTYEELDLLFDKNVPARKFKTYTLDESSQAWR